MSNFTDQDVLDAYRDSGHDHSFQPISDLLDERCFIEQHLSWMCLMAMLAMLVTRAPVKIIEISWPSKPSDEDVRDAGIALDRAYFNETATFPSQRSNPC